MNRIVLTLAFIVATVMAQAQTLEECQKAAEQNYPQIRQYDLIERTTNLTVENIGKGWLPQVSASAQATWQSDVASFPDQMLGLYQRPNRYYPFSLRALLEIQSSMVIVATS